MDSLSTIHSQNEVNTSPLGFAISVSRKLCWALLTALVLVSLHPVEGFALNDPVGNLGPLNAEITKLRIENIKLKKQVSILEDELAKLASNAAHSMPDNTQAGCDAQKLRALLANVDGYDKSKLALLWIRENVRRCTTPEIAFLRRELQDWSSYSVAESLMVLEKEYIKRQ